MNKTRHHKSVKKKKGNKPRDCTDKKARIKAMTEMPSRPGTCELQRESKNAIATKFQVFPRAILIDINSTS